MEKSIKAYWFVLATSLIIFLAIFIQLSNGNKTLVEYLGFAGSITSLVLGIVAIFYSIISNQQSTENFGKLSEAVKKIEIGADTISNLSENIHIKLDKISNDIDNMSSKSDMDISQDARVGKE
ncbi:hypothetical protein [Edaphocola flava]|uniref:hypothetical protein n=1 Tax=Edaphocola flava TaxID=2499629 RepID=UPI00100B215A|nr:hypothetical protein [Edaphocola flava]